MRPIDADVFIAKCGNWYVEEGTEEGFISNLKHLINLQPTIEPEPHWIPIDKRLPDETSDVLCFTDQKEMVIACCYKYDDGDYDFDSYDCDYEGNIIAWMPLPEPYKEGDADD